MCRCIAFVFCLTSPRWCSFQWASMLQLRVSIEQKYMPTSKKLCNTIQYNTIHHIPATAGSYKGRGERGPQPREKVKYSDWSFVQSFVMATSCQMSVKFLCSKNLLMGSSHFEMNDIDTANKHMVGKTSKAKPAGGLPG